jgi:hypothetical protein
LPLSDIEEAEIPDHDDFGSHRFKLMIETSDLCNSAGYQSLSIERPRPTETTRNREGCRFVQSNPVKQTFGRGGKPDGQTEERDPDCGRDKSVETIHEPAMPGNEATRIFHAELPLCPGFE